MKGQNCIKLGIILIAFGFLSLFLFGPLDYLLNFDMGIIAIPTLVIAEFVGSVLWGYGRMKMKNEFLLKLKDLIRKKGKISPPDLKLIEQEVFGSLQPFGAAYRDYVYGNTVEMLRHSWITKRMDEVMNEVSL